MAVVTYAIGQPSRSVTRVSFCDVPVGSASVPTPGYDAAEAALTVEQIVLRVGVCGGVAAAPALLMTRRQRRS